MLNFELHVVLVMLITSFAGRNNFGESPSDVSLLPRPEATSGY